MLISHFLRSIIIDGCPMSIEQNLCEEKTFQLQSMSNVIICIDIRFAFKNLGISVLPWCSTWAIRECQSCTHKKAVQGCEIYYVIYLFFGRTTWSGLVMMLSRSESGEMGSISAGCCAETLCRLSAILRGTEPVSAHTRGFYIAALSIFFFVVEFREWRSRADRIWILNS